MRKLLILCACFALSACGIGAVGTVASIASAAASPKIEIEANRAFSMVALAYEAVANSLTASVEAGQISGEKAVKIRDLNRRALDLLRRGNVALDQGVRSAIFGELLNIVGDLQGIARNEGTLLSWDLLNSYQSAATSCIILTNLNAQRPKSVGQEMKPILPNCGEFGPKLRTDRSPPVTALTQL